MSSRAILAVHLAGHSIFANPMEDDQAVPIMQGVSQDVAGHSNVTGHIQALPEFAGRACYQSFDRPSPNTATNKKYLENILRQRHFSVLEHSMVSFYVTGVSRSLTHELVRHRHFSPSQLSQRYVPVADLKVVVPVLVEKAIKKHVYQVHTPEYQDALGQWRAGGEESVNLIFESRLDDWAENRAFKARAAYGEVETMLRRHFPDLAKKKIREAAREELPNYVETRIVITGNFRTWIEFLQKRDSDAADAQIQRLADRIGVRLSGIAPNIFGPEARALWDDRHSQAAPKPESENNS